MRALALTLLVVTLLLSGACGTSLVAMPLPELEDVEEALGYSLAPTQLPEGFEFSGYDVHGVGDTITPGDQVVMPLGEPRAIVFYKRFKNDASHSILITYPLSFSLSASDDFLLESLGIKWQRPDDAVSEVKVNGETAYLVRGHWSGDSLMKLVNPDPEFLATYTPVWDYEGLSHSLHFDFELSTGEIVGVMIQAQFYPAEWITEKEMAKIAESLRQLD